MICRKYSIAGRVQGVYYRATAARHARDLQIKGYARNLADGRVEVLAYGTEAAHEDFVKRLWVGSSASKVTSIQATDVADSGAVPADFSTG